MISASLSSATLTAFKLADAADDDADDDVGADLGVVESSVAVVSVWSTAGDVVT